LRAFIGILAPENVQNAAVKIQKELQDAGIVGKYVERENLHVNLSFLGEISEEESMEISSKMDMIAKGYKKFTAMVCAIRPIPDIKFTRVIALGVEQEDDLLSKLSNEAQKSIGGDVKPPHMTLCRVRNVKDRKKFVGIVEKYRSACFAAFEIRSIQLIKSELDESGPKYTVIHESILSR